MPKPITHGLCYELHVYDPFGSACYASFMSIMQVLLFVCCLQLKFNEPCFVIGAKLCCFILLCTIQNVQKPSTRFACWFMSLCNLIILVLFVQLWQVTQEIQLI